MYRLHTFLICCQAAFLQGTTVQPLVQQTQITFPPYSFFSNSPPPLLSSDVTASKATSVQVAAYGGITYRYLMPSDESATIAADPVVMVHPVGIGMAAWFWKKIFSEWTNSAAGPTVAPLYAVNLRGCASQDAQASNTCVDVTTPLSLEQWVLDCADFMQDILLRSSSKRKPLFPFRPAKKAGCHLVVQGGLAPVGLVLAHKYPSLVKSLTLTSPPEELTIATEQEIAKNLGLLSSPLGNAAIDVLLENPLAIQLFSDLFLFQSKCDKEWIQQANAEACPEVRKAVQFFNAGGCCRISSSEIQLQQPLLILQGQDDPRMRSRDYYVRSPRVEFQSLPGKNVLPWESPVETTKAIQEFIAGL